MNYFVIILLVVIIFTFLSDKKILGIEQIKIKQPNIDKKIEEVYSESLLVTIDDNFRINKSDISKVIDNKTKKELKKYIILKSNNIELSDITIKTVIANYINEKERPSVFRCSYEYQYISHKTLKNIWEELCLVGINYLNIFSKSNSNLYGVMIFKREDIDEFISNSDKTFITFIPSKDIKMIPKEGNVKELIKTLEKVYNSDIRTVIKSLLLIIVGVIVTSNLIYSIYLIDINKIIISSILYWCYSYVLRYMYSPIGKYKMLSKYLLPIFLVLYLFFRVLNTIKNISIRNKKVQAS